MSRKPDVTGNVSRVEGWSGTPRVVFHVMIPHGKRRRSIQVPVRPEQILAIADAIRCCPEHILETPRTGQPGPGPEAVIKHVAHAIWHLDNPGSPRPCLPDGTKIIDVADDTKLPTGSE